MGYITTPGTEGICPVRWHIPTSAEWTVLTDFLGGADTAGGEMKHAGSTYWHTPNTGATNSSGFTALPGGYDDDGYCWDEGEYACFWTSSDDLGLWAWYLILGYNMESAYQYSDWTHYGFSVRCIHD